MSTAQKTKMLIFSKISNFILKYRPKHQYLLASSYIKVIPTISFFHQYKNLNLKLINNLTNKIDC